MSNEILNQILQEMQDTKAQMNSRFDTLETKISIVEKEISSLKKDTSDLKVDTSDIKVAVHRMAGEVPEDILGILKQISPKLEEKDYDIHTLNKRLFRVESTVERITVEKQ